MAVKAYNRSLEAALVKRIVNLALADSPTDAEQILSFLTSENCMDIRAARDLMEERRGITYGGGVDAVAKALEAFDYAAAGLDDEYLNDATCETVLEYFATSAPEIELGRKYELSEIKGTNLKTCFKLLCQAADQVQKRDLIAKAHTESTEHAMVTIALSLGLQFVAGVRGGKKGRSCDMFLLKGGEGGVMVKIEDITSGFTSDGKYGLVDLRDTWLSWAPDHRPEACAVVWGNVNARELNVWNRMKRDDGHIFYHDVVHMYYDSDSNTLGAASIDFISRLISLCDADDASQKSDMHSDDGSE